VDTELSTVYEYAEGKERMAGRRKSYTREFKIQAVELLNSGGKSGHQIEEELGIGEGTIYRWRRQLEQNGELAFPGNGNERDKELAELRRELAEAREERDILRKAIAIFSDRRRK